MTGWVKSSYSNPSGNCVEVDDGEPALILVRDSKDQSRRVLMFTPRQWKAFLAEIKAQA